MNNAILFYVQKRKNSTKAKLKCLTALSDKKLLEEYIYFIIFANVLCMKILKLF